MAALVQLHTGFIGEAPIQQFACARPSKNNRGETRVDHAVAKLEALKEPASVRQLRGMAPLAERGGWLLREGEGRLDGVAEELLRSRMPEAPLEVSEEEGVHARVRRLVTRGPREQGPA